MAEKCPDPLDQATQYAEEALAESVDHYSRLAQPEQRQVLVMEDGVEVLQWETEDCVDCGYPIEPGRLELAKVRCFTCQSLKDKRNKTYGRR